MRRALRERRPGRTWRGIPELAEAPQRKKHSSPPPLALTPWEVRGGGGSKGEEYLTLALIHSFRNSPNHPPQQKHPDNDPEMWLFGSRKPESASVDQLQALEKRLAVLEAEQHPARLAEWHDLAEKLKRYLSRISAVEQRMKDREDGPNAANPQLAAILRAKFPHQNGG